MTDKFIKKYMRVAKLVGEDQNPCYSRHIGAVIVNNEGDKILGAGYNGPLRKLPHCDHPEYLQQIVWPQLTADEKQRAIEQIEDWPKQAAIISQNAREQKTPIGPDQIEEALFVANYANCRTCPRRIVGAPSGTRLELCSCVHAETNAFLNASGSVKAGHIFIWCDSGLLPCAECVKLIIQSQLTTVYCVGGDAVDYHFSPRTLLRLAGIDLIIKPAEWYLTD